MYKFYTFFIKFSSENIQDHNGDSFLLFKFNYLKKFRFDGTDLA